MTIANRWKTEGKGTEENRRKRKLEHKGLGCMQDQTRLPNMTRQAAEHD